MRQFLSLIIIIFLLLIFHNEVISGTQSGLLLWYQTLIPALLPFLLITNALSETNAYEIIGYRLKKYFPHIYEYIAITLGNLCGYPIGAKILNDLVNKEYISPQNANSLLAVSSQVSPMFLLGYIYIQILDGCLPLSILIAAIYIPVIILYLCKRIFVRRQSNSDTRPPKPVDDTSTIYVQNTFLEASKTMLFIGIYVIIFSIILNILLSKISNVDNIQYILSTLEITNGLKLLKASSLPAHKAIYMYMWLTSFGGLCTAYQIKSVLNYSGSSIKKYLIDKIILSSGTYIIIWLYIH